MLCLMGNTFHPILQLLLIIALFINPIFVNFKNIIFMVVVVPDFREGQVENRAKTREMLNFPGFCGKIFSISP